MNAITFHKDVLVVDQAKLDAMSQTDLVALAKETNSNAVKAAKQTLLHAGQTGVVLLALKEKIDHGQFLKHVKWQTDISPRTAQTYMAIAAKYETVSHLRGVRDAIGYIRDAAQKSKVAAQRPSPAPITIVEAEIVEPLSPAEVEDLIENAPPDILEAEAAASESDALNNPEPTNDHMLDALEILQHLTQGQLRQLVSIINTRWIR